jgi:hypothetical protein
MGFAGFGLEPAAVQAEGWSLAQTGQKNRFGPRCFGLTVAVLSLSVSLVINISLL